MILGFSTKINGKPTFFVDKIWSGLIDHKLSSIYTCRYYESKREEITPNEFAIVPHYTPKIHTIREDKKNRWRVNMKIDFFINVRTKLMFQFAPKQRVLRIQNIEIINTEFMNDKIITIDGKVLVTSEINLLAMNDGFETTKDFFDYFDKDFSGKLIHWTNLRY